MNKTFGYVIDMKAGDWNGNQFSTKSHLFYRWQRKTRMEMHWHTQKKKIRHKAELKSILWLIKILPRSSPSFPFPSVFMHFPFLAPHIILLPPEGTVLGLAGGHSNKADATGQNRQGWCAERLMSVLKCIL